MASLREIRIAYHLADIRNWKSIQAHGLLSTQKLVELSANVPRSGVTPEDWFELLNSKVFFWLDLDRLNSHRAACGNQKQVVLAIDTGRLLEKYSVFASVSPIDSGNAKCGAAPRNLATFAPYEKWTESGWDREAVPGASVPPGNAWPTELAISGGIPDIVRFIIGSVYMDSREQLTERHIVTAARCQASQAISSAD